MHVTHMATFLYQKCRISRITEIQQRIQPQLYFQKIILKPLSKCGVYHNEGHIGKIICVCRYILYMRVV